MSAGKRGASGLLALFALLVWSVATLLGCFLFLVAPSHLTGLLALWLAVMSLWRVHTLLEAL